MSVSSILTSLEAQVAATLGSDYKELEYIYDLEANNSKSIDKRYGVGVDAGDTVPGTNKAITFDFNFFVILTRSYVNKSSDESERVVISDLHDQLEAIDVNVFQKKLNNANVLLVSSISHDAPEKIEKGGVALRVNFVVKFRKQTTN